MKIKIFTLLCIAFFTISFSTNKAKTSLLQSERFNFENDLLLVQFDCKTDVDDLHTVAALASLLSNATYNKLQVHAVAGTYGIQEGLYVPGNELFELAFENNWTDAHENFEVAVQRVSSIIKETLRNQGDVWIAEAGQSDFSAALIRAVKVEMPDINTSKRIHIVQHSDWNEKVTSPKDLDFVRENSDYNKIPDGNAIGNGTPGFRTPEFNHWNSKITNQDIKEIWELAVELGVKYNGKEGRYNNEAIAAGGLDFSDLSEVCWIFGLEGLMDTAAFFDLFVK